MTVSVDHLPPAIRRALVSGATLADFGTESDDYLKLLGLTPQQGGGILTVRGLTLDGELAGFVAVYEPRRRFGNRVVERLSPAIDLFALAFERIAEHDARFEAVQALRRGDVALRCLVPGYRPQSATRGDRARAVAAAMATLAARLNKAA